MGPIDGAVHRACLHRDGLPSVTIDPWLTGRAAAAVRHFGRVAEFDVVVDFD